MEVCEQQRLCHGLSGHAVTHLRYANDLDRDTVRDRSETSDRRGNGVCRLVTPVTTQPDGVREVRPRTALSLSFTNRILAQMRTRTLAAVILLCFSSPDSAWAQAATASTLLTMEVTVTRGKASLPRQNRVVRKLRIEMAVGGDTTRVEQRVATPMSLGPVEKESTQFVPIGLALSGAAQPGAGGTAQVWLRLDDHEGVPASFPGSTARVNRRGLTVETTVNVPLAVDSMIELALLDDPASDRTWEVVAKVLAVRGAPPRPSGSSPGNPSFLARVEEAGAKGLTTATIRLAVAAAAAGRVADELSVPVAVAGDQGRALELVPFSVGLSVTPSGRTDTWAIELAAARQAASPPVQKERAWEQRGASRTLLLLPGAGPAEIGAVTDGAGHVLFRGTVEVAVLL